jgi:hypothetical protein
VLRDPKIVLDVRHVIHHDRLYQESLVMQVPCILAAALSGRRPIGRDLDGRPWGRVPRDIAGPHFRAGSRFSPAGRGEKDEQCHKRH